MEPVHVIPVMLAKIVMNVHRVITIRIKIRKIYSVQRVIIRVLAIAQAQGLKNALLARKAT